MNCSSRDPVEITQCQFVRIPASVMTAVSYSYSHQIREQTPSCVRSQADTIKTMSDPITDDAKAAWFMSCSDALCYISASFNQTNIWWSGGRLLIWWEQALWKEISSRKHCDQKPITDSDDNVILLTINPQQTDGAPLSSNYCGLLPWAHSPGDSH